MINDHSVWISVPDHCEDGIIITNRDKKIVYHNKRIEGLFKDIDFSESLSERDIPMLSLKYIDEKSAKINLDHKAILMRKVHADHGYDIFYFRDISAEEELCDQLNSDKQIFDLINAGILISNRDGTIEVFNSFLEKMEGRSREKVIGKSIAEAYHTTEENSEQLTVLRTKETLWNVNLDYIINGKHINTLSTTYPIFINDRLVKVASISRNVTTTRQLLENVMKYYTAVNRDSSGSNGAHFHFNDILGNSSQIKNAIEKAVRSTRSRAPVMIYGETGTGKELFAQSIHNGSCDSDPSTPFVAINCASIPEQLLESILFGTVKGSYTDAKNNIGLFEQAGNGTLFLDEVNSMPIRLQTKILRVLQEKVVRRLGDSVERPINCRIISSCNKEPIQCVKEGTIREDLYYRLVVISIEIPPLRERGEDIIDLTRHFLKYYGRIYCHLDLDMSKDFMQALYDHSWPGNVRELEHVVESSVAMLDDEKILDIQHLPLTMRTPPDGSQYRQNFYCVEHKKKDLNGTLAEIEQQMIIDALEESSGNISRAGKLLGISRQNMQYRMKKFGIKGKNIKT